MRHVLEGSVRRAGNRVRVTAELIDAATGAHLWADRYDGDLADVFAVQDAVTLKIVEALKVRLTRANGSGCVMRIRLTIARRSSRQTAPGVVGVESEQAAREPAASTGPTSIATCWPARASTAAP